MFKVWKFQFDILSRFGMVEEKQEGAVFSAPPCKIGLTNAKAKMQVSFNVNI